MRHCRVIPGTLVCLCGLLAGGCGVSFSYSSSSAERVLTEARQQQSKLVVVDLMDGRAMGKPSKLPLATGQTRQNDFSYLRQAIREHAANAGLTVWDAPWPAAPGTPDEAATILKQAQQQGARAVLFLRLDNLYARGRKSTAVAIIQALIPLGVGLVMVLITNSLPVNSEYSAARVRAYLVDPVSGKLLFSAAGEGVLKDDKVSAWGFSPMSEMKGVIFKAVEEAFGKVGQTLASHELPKAGDTDALSALFAPAAAMAARSENDE